MIEFNKHPIPGMSLTGEPGNNPWEQPPLYVELDDVVAYYVEKMTTETAVANLLKAMKTDAPLTAMAETAIKAGMMKGVHSIDVGMLALPIIVELMKTIGDMNGVGYVVEPEDMKTADDIDESVAKEVLAEAVKTVKADPDVKRGGLMAKGEK